MNQYGPLRSLCYLSLGDESLTEQDVHVLVTRAAAKNTRLGISGYMTYLEGMFWQYLEGQPEPVRMLYGCIRGDGRHSIVSAIDLPSKRIPWFPAWGMHHLTNDDLITFAIGPDIQDLMWQWRDGKGSPDELKDRVITLTLRLRDLSLQTGVVQKDEVRYIPGA